MSRDGSGRRRSSMPDWWGGFGRNTDTSSDGGWSMSFGGNAHNGTALTTRHNIARYAGLQFGGDRDLYDVLGWDRNPKVEDYWATYLRNPLGRVIVNAPASTSWRVSPDVSDDADADNQTQFEEAVETLFDRQRVTHYMERADKVAGIGEYGIIVLGLADGAESMSDPAEADSLDSPSDINYLATFSQDRVTDIDLVTDPTSERYGLPEYYDVQFDVEETHGRAQRVHYSRVIHVAEGLLEDEVYGRPRLEAVFNTLFDIEKVLGGAAEMTWRGAGLRMQLDIDPNMGQVPDAENVAEQAEEMAMGLRHIMRTRGTDMNVIEGETVDPSGITGELFKLVAGETGIPKRILTGSERGELASTQDRATFLGRITERQEQFCEPQMLRPFLDRLVELGVLPEPQGGVDGYEVEWPPLFELSDLEQAELMEKMAQAMKTAAPMGDPGQLATVAEIRKEVLDWEPERGGEVDMEDDPEQREAEIDEMPETDEDRDAFEEILESVDDLDGDPTVPVATDGGDEP